ncbi:MAG: hypothetical protein H0X40_08695 [Chthoniobacterales bacterium]|nr:hypothetical protein [Chthoniobacterales bacterium]
MNGNGTVSQTNGVLDLTQHAPTPTLAIGSLEGNGEVLLYSVGYQFHDLIVGGNNLSTTFGGVIHGFNGQGTLYKRGRGTLTLAGSNLHGGTVIDGGAVLTRNTAGSATGLGPVTVNRGKLGGTGIIAGAVTVGAKPGSPATLTPGNSSTLGTLTLQSSVTFSGTAIYDCAINSARIDSDKVIAQGVTIQSGQISLVDNGTGVLPAGTTFTLLDNTSAAPISGNFQNLLDQSTVTLSHNAYRVSYEGGDGNDLTLTVLSP